VSKARREAKARDALAVATGADVASVPGGAARGVAASDKDAPAASVVAAMGIVEAKSKRARARPTTDDGCAIFVEAARLGATEREAEAEAGVNRAAVRNHPEWGPRLAAAQAEYTSAQRRIVETVARGEVEDSGQARAMFAAASWILTKRDRDTYGERQRTDLHVTPTDETTAARLAAAIDASRRPEGGDDE